MTPETLIPFLSIQPLPAVFLIALVALCVVAYALSKIPKR
jgi:hypothetical protein